MTTALRICQILCGTGYAGLERHVVELANGLADRGHAVTFIAHPEYAARLAPGVRCEPLDLTGWRLNPLLLWRLLCAVRRSRPDVVHAQANKAAAMLAWIAPFVRARRVATLHNIKRSTAAFRRCDGVIAVSRAAAARLARPCVTVIPNGIHPSTVSAQPDYLATTLGRALHRPLVLAVGRLVPAKGFDILIEAWRGIDATLVIAGAGPGRDRLQELIDRYGLSERVLLLGHRDDVPSLLADADLVVIASRREGFPYVMVEALHARKVIVATRVAGVEDVLPADCLVPCEDAAALHERLKRVLADIPAVRRVCTPAWDYAATELTVDRMVQHTEEFYRQVIAGPMRSGASGADPGDDGHDAQ